MQHWLRMAVLDSAHRIVPCELNDYAPWLSRKDKPWRVARNVLKPYRISTVFLNGLIFGVHNRFPAFETVIFKDIHQDEESCEPLYIDRHFSWEEATAAHRKVVAAVRVGLLP